MKFEYLSNPYYCDVSRTTLQPLDELQQTVENLTKELVSIDVESHNRYYEKVVRSFSNLKFRWKIVHESGTLAPPQIKYD